VTQDDALYRFRLRVFALAEELGNARAACRAMGIHPSTYYRWRRQLLAYGPEILRPRERRHPRMANATSPLGEQRVVALALGHPGFGPARISAELRRAKWEGSGSAPTGSTHSIQPRSLKFGLRALFRGAAQATNRARRSISRGCTSDNSV
jgi:hypothetical protein